MVLDFDAIDDLARAVQLDRLRNHQPTKHVARSLAPLAELVMCKDVSTKKLVEEGWLDVSEVNHLHECLTDEVNGWTVHGPKNFGLLNTEQHPFAEGDPLYTSFMLAIQKAVEITGFTASTGRKLAGAVQELESNIHEHSQRPSSGFLAFNATNDMFEVVIADRGIGVLESFRGTAAFENIETPGDALKLATTKGVSRLADEARGFGFNQLFVALAGMSGYVRFHSDDFCLSLNGTPDLESHYEVKEKAELKGFFTSLQLPRSPQRLTDS